MTPPIVKGFAVVCLNCREKSKPNFHVNPPYFYVQCLNCYHQVRMKLNRPQTTEDEWDKAVLPKRKYEKN